MRDRTKDTEHKLRMALLECVHALADVRTIIASPTIDQPERDFYEQMLDRAQRAIHAIQERADQRPPRRADGH